MIKELYIRMTLETPKFFKKLQIICGFISGTSIVIINSLQQYLPPVINTWLGYAAACGIVSIIISQATVQCTDHIDEHPLNKKE